MPSDDNEARLNRYKDRLTDKISDSEALKLLLKLRQIRPVTFQLLQQTRIGNAINSWKQQNSGRLQDQTLRQADKLIQKWKKEMEKQSVKTESSSDSSEDSESDREVKSEFVKSEPQYSPGGGDSPNESYTPAKPKKEKPYRPGGFFFDDDEEEEEDDDNEMAEFIQGEEVDEDEEEDSNPFFNSGRPKFDDDDEEDIEALLAAEQAKLDKEERRREDQIQKELLKKQKREEKRKEEKRKLKEEQKLKEERRRKKDEEAKNAEKLKLKAEKKLAEKRKLELEEHEKRKAKKRKLKEAEAKADEQRKAEAKSEKIRKLKEMELEKRRAEKERKRRSEEAARQKVKSEPIVKTEPVTDPFGSSDDDSSDDQSHLNVKSEPRNDDQPTQYQHDPFDDSNSDSDQDHSQPNIKIEPFDPDQSNQFKLPSSTNQSQNGKKKDPKAKVPLVKLAEKSKERRKKEKKRTKTNQIVKQEIDTSGFSFDAMLTMNTAKVKKSKKIKSSTINEHDESVLEFESTSVVKKSSSKLKETLKKKKAEMTDAEAALLATTRKQGNHLMSSQKKVRYVSKVYNLFDLSLKTIKNNPKYLLAPHDFMYSADIIMPAMERLDEKCLHKLEKMQPHLMEDTNHIWRQLCLMKFGAKSCESVEGSGESWKEGFTRLFNENNAKLNFLAKKISKKKEKEEKSNLKSKLAFVQGHVKAPRHVQAAQMRYGTGNDIRNKKYDVHIPGITNEPAKRYSTGSGQIDRRPKPIGNRVNIASDAARRPERPGTSSSSSSDKKKPAPLMKKALAGIRGYKR